jgi:hypothetical protein
MDLIEERGSFQEAGKATDGACSVLIMLVGRAQCGFEEVVEELGS